MYNLIYIIQIKFKMYNPWGKMHREKPKYKRETNKYKKKFPSVCFVIIWRTGGDRKMKWDKMPLLSSGALINTTDWTRQMETRKHECNINNIQSRSQYTFYHMGLRGSVLRIESIVKQKARCTPWYTYKALIVGSARKCGENQFWHLSLVNNNTRGKRGLNQMITVLSANNISTHIHLKQTIYFNSKCPHNIHESQLYIRSQRETQWFPKRSHNTNYTLCK